MPWVAAVVLSKEAVSSSSVKQPLHSAAKKGNADSLRSLVADGALSQDQLERDNLDFTALAWACRAGVYPAFRPFLRRVRPSTAVLT